MKQFIERFVRPRNPLPFEPLRFKSVLGWMISAVLGFQLAYSIPQLSVAMLVYLFALLQLAQVRSTRQAVYLGLIVGLAAYGPQLHFFWNIFGPGAISLWLVLSFWLAAFLVTCAGFISGESVR